MAWRQSSHYLNQWLLDYWRVYASLGLNELNEYSNYIGHNVQLEFLIWSDRIFVLALISDLERTKMWCERVQLCWKNMKTTVSSQNSFNTLRSRHNGRHFADDLYKCIFLNENIWISINISLKFVPRCPINNIPTLVQVIWLGTDQATNHYLNQWWLD